MKKMRIMVLALMVLMAGLLPGIAGPGTAYAEVSVSYVDAAGQAHNPVDCRPMTSSVTTWGADGQTTWYAVTNSVTIASRVVVKGNVNLILCDEKKLTAKEGINVEESNSLTVWVQSSGTGILYAGTTDGTDTTNNSYYSGGAGIGGGRGGNGGSVTINGGTVYAHGGPNSAGIGGGYYLSQSNGGLAAR